MLWLAAKRWRKSERRGASPCPGAPASGCAAALSAFSYVSSLSQQCFSICVNAPRRVYWVAGCLAPCHVGYEGCFSGHQNEWLYFILSVLDGLFMCTICNVSYPNSQRLIITQVDGLQKAVPLHREHLWLFWLTPSYHSCSRKAAQAYNKLIKRNICSCTGKIHIVLHILGFFFFILALFPFPLIFSSQ